MWMINVKNNNNTNNTTATKKKMEFVNENRPDEERENKMEWNKNTDGINEKEKVIVCI